MHKMNINEETEKKLSKMTSSSNLRKGSVWRDKLFEMINQEFKAQGREYQVLPNFRVCCRVLGGSKVRHFGHVCAVSALSNK